jgi:hypothetical protein
VDPHPAEVAAGEPVQHCGQERPVARGETRPGRAQLPLQDPELVP